MTKKKTVWLCILAVVAVCAAVWLWPRSIGAITGATEKQMEGWAESTWLGDCDIRGLIRGEAVGATPNWAGREILLAGLSTFRFSRPVYDDEPTFQGGKAEGYSVSFLPNSGRVVNFFIRPDGALWVNEWRYKLVGGKAELERLNRWFDDMLTKRVGS